MNVFRTRMVLGTVGRRIMAVVVAVAALFGARWYVNDRVETGKEEVLVEAKNATAKTATDIATLQKSVADAKVVSERRLSDVEQVANDARDGVEKTGRILISTNDRLGEISVQTEKAVATVKAVVEDTAVVAKRADKNAVIAMAKATAAQEAVDALTQRMQILEAGLLELSKEKVELSDSMMAMNEELLQVRKASRDSSAGMTKRLVALDKEVKLIKSSRAANSEMEKLAQRIADMEAEKKAAKTATAVRRAADGQHEYCAPCGGWYRRGLFGRWVRCG